MYELRFDPQLCFSCQTFSCLTECKYLRYGFDEAREERVKIARGEYSRVLEECMTCYGCEEYCEQDNHPFYRLVELQERFGVRVADDGFLAQLVERYRAEDEFRPKEVGGKVVHICLFPQFRSAITGRLFEGYDVVRGRHLFCNLIYLHYGLISVIKERAARTIDNFRKLGIEEVVMYHDECYGFYTSFARAYGIEVPFKAVHLFDHLHSRLREMESEIVELGVRVAYQRPCSNRLSPETDRTLDRIFELIGVERVEREYDRTNALCCGASFEFKGDFETARKLQERNIGDMVDSGASHVVFNCPMCYLTLGKKVRDAGLTPVMVSELCKMAIGEEPFMLF
ncbi:heterodisulfide reductase-related iron-sulfur binding cluster [Geoglobus sp.]